MKKVAVVFVLAVVAPSLALAWLAARSLRDQERVLERQDQILCQQVAEKVAREVREIVFDRQREFGQVVEKLLTVGEPMSLAMDFDRRIREAWPLAALGFSVALDGDVLSPAMWTSPEALRFRMENDQFLCSRDSIQVVYNSPKGPVNLGLPNRTPGLRPARDSTVYATRTGVGLTFRPDSPDDAHFRQIVGDTPSGTLARFLQDELNLLFWYRSPQSSTLVYGAHVRIPTLLESIRPALRGGAVPDQAFAATLRDEASRTVAVSRDDFDPAALKPFLVLPLGELLPHWDVAVYLVDPARHSHGAATFRLLTGLFIGIALLAIGVGSWLIVADLRRQLTLARQKTDFVSNVSHELKTPLTSIRMFAEMLAEGRVEGPEKQAHFLRIISAEASRLTRLINNVLDFARLERGERRFVSGPVDLGPLVKETVETFRPAAEAAGFTLDYTLPPVPAVVTGDRDALAQVLLNLLSNAEKYSGPRREIQVVLHSDPATPAWRLEVTDRGPGVPEALREKIFEQFYRVNDSLSSGVQGSGLGLTLARQIARQHGGDVRYAPRSGGGSAFTVVLPIRDARETAAGAPPAAAAKEERS